jgi:hypothetical protein
MAGSNRLLGFDLRGDQLRNIASAGRAPGELPPGTWSQAHPNAARKRAAHLDAAVPRRNNRAVREIGYLSSSFAGALRLATVMGDVTPNHPAR